MIKPFGNGGKLTRRVAPAPFSDSIPAQGFSDGSIKPFVPGTAVKRQFSDSQPAMGTADGKVLPFANGGKATGKRRVSRWAEDKE